MTKAPHSCAFFNNKGGVGKTTAIANLGHQLGLESQVVAVDLDPQCNLTQHFLQDEEWERIFSNLATSGAGTVWSYLEPLSKRRPLPEAEEYTIPFVRNDRFSFSLIAGHPFVAQMDDHLASEWAHTQLASAGAVDSTFWCAKLIEQIVRSKPDVEYILFDLGPSLGPTNRSVILAADSFMAPVSPDLFSLYSFANLESWFGALSDAMQAVGVAVGRKPDLQGEWWSEKVTNGLGVEFLGYISQEYVTRLTKGERRATKSFEVFNAQIPDRARGVVRSLPDNGHKLADEVTKEPAIGIMPHMFSMVAKSHSVHAPIQELSGADGLTGSQFKQRDKYASDIATLTREWKRRMDLSNDE